MNLIGVSISDFKFVQCCYCSLDATVHQIIIKENKVYFYGYCDQHSDRATTSVIVPPPKDIAHRVMVAENYGTLKQKLTRTPDALCENTNIQRYSFIWTDAHGMWYDRLLGEISLSRYTKEELETLANRISKANFQRRKGDIAWTQTLKPNQELFSSLTEEDLTVGQTKARKKLKEIWTILN
jgi:hypothetical protein